MSEYDHPRDAVGHPWVPNSQGLQLAPCRTGNGGVFVPTVFYIPEGDLLKILWGWAEDFMDRGRVVSLARAIDCRDLIQACTIWGASRFIPIQGQDDPASSDFDPEAAVADKATFKPFVHYDREADTLLVRWQAGTQVVEIEDDQGGHPMTMILDAEKEPEDRPDQKPWLLVGVKIHELSRAEVPVKRS